MLKGFDYNLATRFVSDLKLPVLICSDPDTFEYELNLYEKDFGSMSKWNELVENIEKEYAGNVDAFLKKFYEVRDNIITTTENSEEYKAFNNSADYKTWSAVKYPDAVNSKSIYNQENINKEFISIDMKKANFQAMRYAGVIKEDSYEDFLAKFADGYMLTYLTLSKYVRSVVFGKLNPSRTIKLEKYLLTQAYNDKIKDVYPGTVMYFGSDEIVLSVANVENETELYQNLINSVATADIDLRIERYTMEGYEFFVKKPDGIEHKLGEFYKRSCDTPGKYKAIPLPYHKILYKLLKNAPVNNLDRELMYEKCRVRLLDEITINKL